MDAQALLLTIKNINSGIDNPQIAAKNACDVISKAIPHPHVYLHIGSFMGDLYIKVMTRQYDVKYMLLYILPEDFSMSNEHWKENIDKMFSDIIAAIERRCIVLTTASDIDELEITRAAYASDIDTSGSLESVEIKRLIVERINEHIDDAWAYDSGGMKITIFSKIKIEFNMNTIYWAERVIRFAVALYHVFVNPVSDIKYAGTQ